MTKITKRMISIILALIMAMPAVFAIPEAAGADSNLLAHWDFESTLFESTNTSEFSFNRHWGSQFHYDSGYYFGNGWIADRTVSSVFSSAYNKHWSMELEFMFPDGSGDIRQGQYIMGITNSTAEGVEQTNLFGMSANGHIYLKGTDISGSSVFSFNYNDSYVAKANYDNRLHYNLAYTYDDGTLAVYIDDNVVFVYSVSDADKPMFESVGQITLGACGWDGGSLVVYDLAIYSTASAITKNATFLRSATLGSNNYSRYDANWLSILNEGDNNVIDAGLWLYDLKNIPCAAGINSATATIEMAGASKATMLEHFIDFYYISGDNQTYNDYCNKQHNVVDWGLQSTGVANYKTNLGLTNANHFAAIPHKDIANGVTFTFDMTEAIIKAKQNNWNSIIIVAVQRNFANYGEENSWMEMYVYNPSISISYNAPVSKGTETELKAANAAYASKMSSGVYTNMKAAYDAYVVTNRYIDAIDYGELKNMSVAKLKTATDNLVSATDNMKAWTSKTGNTTLAADYSYSKSSLVKNVTAGNDNNTWTVNNYSDEMENVLYTYGVSNKAFYTEPWITVSSSPLTRVFLQFGPIVFLYDGITAPATPINACNHYAQESDDVTSIYLNGVSGLSLAECWHGSLSSSNGYNTGYGEIYHTTQSNQNPTGDTEQYIFSTTTLKYTGDNSTGFSNYLRTYNSTSWGAQLQANSNNIGTGTHNTSIYVIDYKSLIDSITAKSSCFNSIASYKEGGLSALLTALDSATAIDPNQYVFYHNAAVTSGETTLEGVSALSDDIGTAITAITGASVTNDVYPALRNEMKASAHIVDSVREGIFTGYEDYQNAAELKNIYTSDSVDAFTDAYWGASWHMAVLEDWPYEWVHTGVSVSDRLTALTTAHHNMVKKADFSDFDAAYSAADAFLDGIVDKAAKYNASDVDALITLLNNSEVQDYATQSANDRKNFADGGDEDTQATALAGQINSAVAAVKNPAAPGTVDLSSYQAVVDQLEKIDSDAFDYSAEERTSDLNTYTRFLKTTVTYDGQTINVVRDNVNQSLVDSVTSFLQSRANAHIREYKIDIVSGKGYIADSAGVTFTGGNSRYDESEGVYYATYGTKVNFMAKSDKAVWYMEYYSETASRNEQYQDTGKYFSANVFGNLNISVKAPSDGYEVVIYRSYSDNDRTPLSVVDYVDGSYTVPNASALPFYSFDGYTLNGEAVSPGDVLSITSDTVIIAHYSVNEGLPFAINIDADGFENKSASYNGSVTLEGNENTYAWLEKKLDSSSYKPFYIGRDVSFFATESINLKPVTEEEFIAGGYSVPNINVRQSGTILITTDGKKKVTFNGQFVTDGTKSIVEYGVLMGKATPSGSISAGDVVLENIDASDSYTLTRFKSTKDVGAHQFTISVNGLSGDIIYKGYITYKNAGGTNITVYTDAMYETI